MPKIAMAQAVASSSMEANLKEALKAIAEAAHSGADIVLFPEIFLSPFFPKHQGFDASEYLIEIGGREVSAMQKACAENKVIAAPNFYLREGASRFDATVLIDRDGSLIGTAKMVHITQAPSFFEQDYYDPSNAGFCVFDTDAGRVGIVICFDRHYPESFRSCVLKGADIILVPTANMESEPVELFQWEMCVSAFQNSVYIAMCNRAGTEDTVSYCGRSMLVGPDGQLICSSGSAPALDVAEYDLEHVRLLRTQNSYLRLYDSRRFDLQDGSRKISQSPSGP